MVPREPPLEKRKEVIERIAVIKARAVFPRSFRLDRSVTISRDESRGGVEALDLPANVQLELAAAVDEQRELDARGSGVENDDRVGHRRPSHRLFLGKLCKASLANQGAIPDSHGGNPAVVGEHVQSARIQQ